MHWQANRTTGKAKDNTFATSLMTNINFILQANHLLKR